MDGLEKALVSVCMCWYSFVGAVSRTRYLGHILILSEWFEMV